MSQNDTSDTAANTSSYHSKGAGMTQLIRQKLNFTNESLWKRFSARRLELIDSRFLSEKKASEQDESIKEVSNLLRTEFGYPEDNILDFEKLVRAGIQSVRRNRKRIPKSKVPGQTYLHYHHPKQKGINKLAQNQLNNSPEDISEGITHQTPGTNDSFKSYQSSVQSSRKSSPGYNFDTPDISETESPAPKFNKCRAARSSSPMNQDSDSDEIMDDDSTAHSSTYEGVKPRSLSSVCSTERISINSLVSASSQFARDQKPNTTTPHVSGPKKRLAHTVEENSKDSLMKNSFSEFPEVQARNQLMLLNLNKILSPLTVESYTSYLDQCANFNGQVYNHSYLESFGNSILETALFKSLMTLQSTEITDSPDTIKSVFLSRELLESLSRLLPSHSNIPVDSLMSELLTKIAVYTLRNGLDTITNLLSRMFFEIEQEYIRIHCCSKNEPNSLSPPTHKSALAQPVSISSTYDTNRPPSHSPPLFKNQISLPKPFSLSATKPQQLSFIQQPFPISQIRKPETNNVSDNVPLPSLSFLNAQSNSSNACAINNISDNSNSISSESTRSSRTSSLSSNFNNSTCSSSIISNSSSACSDTRTLLSTESPAIRRPEIIPVTLRFFNRKLDFTYSPSRSTPPTMSEILENGKNAFNILGENKVLKVRDLNANKTLETDGDLEEIYNNCSKIDLELFFPAFDTTNRTGNNNNCPSSSILSKILPSSLTTRTESSKSNEDSYRTKKIVPSISSFSISTEGIDKNNPAIVTSPTDSQYTSSNRPSSSNNSNNTQHSKTSGFTHINRPKFQELL